MKTITRKSKENVQSVNIMNHKAAYFKNLQTLTVAEFMEHYLYTEALINILREPIVILYPNFKIKTANKSFFDTFYLTKEGITDKPFFELESGQWNIPQLKKLLKTVLPKSNHVDNLKIEHTFEHVGKKILILNARSVFLEGDSIHLIALAIDDITNLVEQEESSHFHKTLLEHIPAAVITTDSSYAIRTWNRGAEELYGWRAKDVIGKDSSFLRTEFPSYSRKPSIDKLFEKGYWTGHVKQQKIDGTPVDIYSTTTILKDKDSNILGSLSINRDITEQKRAEEKLQESQSNLAFLAEASKFLSSSLDYNTTLQRVAKSAVPHVADWCGVDMLDVHGELKQIAVTHKDPKKIAWAKAYRKTNPPKMSDTSGIPDVIRSGKSVLYPFITDEMIIASAKSKKELDLMRSLHMRSAMIVPVLINNKAIGAISFITSDNQRHYSDTDLAMAEELASRASLAIENARLYKEAQKEIAERKKLEKQKDEFIGIASHELKTPVTSIKSFAQVLRLKFTKEGNQQAADLLGKLDAQVDKLTSLIGDLLDVTKIEAGRMQFNDEYFAFDELVTELTEELQRTTNKHQLRIIGRTKHTIFGDRERIGQVITNLVSNAIKYSPYAKEILIQTSIQDGHVKLCVQDFGVGIAKEKQEKVFERFFRVSGPGKETYPGLGLGLYISSEIIKRSQGEIWVESTEGRGSTFCFTLPIKKRTSLSKRFQRISEESIKHE